MSATRIRVSADFQVVKDNAFSSVEETERMLYQGMSLPKALIIYRI